MKHDMKQRVFIAINLPEDVKNALANYQKKWPDLPARWTPTQNLHITLIFIGYADEEGISEIQQIIKDVIVRQKAFSIRLNKISYGPPKIIPPRMIWAVGEKSEEFTSLCDNLGQALADSPKISFKPENRETIPHVTLARIKEWEWRRIEPEERPEVGESINLSFEVKSIELMESVLKKSGAEYKILESYKLNE